MRLSDRTRSIAVALALAVAAALIITLAVKKSGKSSSTRPVGTVSVFVATRDIPVSSPGSELSGKIRREDVPRTSVVPGAISDTNQVRTLVSTSIIYSGEQISTRRFQPQVAQGVRGQITGNERAFQLPGDANQLLVGTLQAGDRVDLIGNIRYKPVDFRQTREATNQAAATFVATRLILRNLLILRGPESPVGAGKFGGSSNYALQIAVTDSQSQKLFYIMKNGDWWLELRPAHGAADSPESVETTGSILGDGLRPPQFLQLVFGSSAPR